ncbi:MAG: hypothetical protein IPK71_22265 [Myxococcales bacterium]|nr:hypothetical protein [Myxococcales bacterium]
MSDSVSRARRLLPVVGLAVLAFGASCYQGAKAPQVSAQRTLDLGKEGAGTTSQKPFGVVFGGPRGQLSEASEVTVVFNRPMRPLSLAGEETTPPLRIEPAAKGAFRWMGTSAVSFIPDPALPRATTFKVTVPAGTRSLDGQTIEKDYVFELSTPRPKVVRVHPGEGSDHLTPHTTFELWTNQPVDAKAVEAGVKLLVHDQKVPRAVPFTVSFPKADVPTRLVVSPQKPLPLGTNVELVVEGLRGKEGPLPSEGRHVTSMRTYGPLVANELGCSTSTPNRRCAARGGFWLSLSNRVTEAELRAHLRVEGDAKLAWPKLAEAGSHANATSHFSLPVRTRAARSFKVTLTAGLKDEYGQVLARDRVFPVQTDDEWPNVEVGVEGSVFEALRQDPKGHSREVPIGATNVDEFEVVTAPLGDDEVARMLSTRDTGETRYTFVSGLTKAKSQTVRPQAEKNTTATQWVPLADALGPRGRGAVALGVRRRDGQRKNVDVRLLQVTDLAISARLSRFGSVVWVTKLSDGKPVGGAEISVRDKTGKSQALCTTDPSGLCAVSRDAWSPKLPGAYDGSDDATGEVLFARQGGDVSFRRVAEIVSPWRQAHPVDLHGGLEPYGMLFTDRGIYKTGETVHVKGLFREPLPRGTQVPRGRPVSFAAYDRDGNELVKKTVSLGPFGDFAVDVPIPAAGKLGPVDLRADVPGDGGEGHVAATVDVAAYRPAEFAAHVEGEKPSYVRGDKAAFVTRGDYLFGAPMSGGKVRTSVRHGRGFFAISGLEGVELTDEAFLSSLPESEPRGGALASTELPLDKNGQARTEVPLVLPKQSGPEVVTVESEIEDVSRQTGSAQTSVIVHPGEFYVASVPPKDFFVKAGAPYRAEALCVAPDGARRAGVSVKLEAIRRTWHTIVEESGEDGLHYESRPVDKVVSTCTAQSSASGSAACDLAIAEPGYLIVRATAQDARKNPLASSVGFYATGDATDLAWQRTDASLLELVTDKKSYEVGDTAKILVKNPFRDAEALVTVERAGVYKQDRVKLSGPMPTLEVKVADDMRPNVYVTVSLVRGRVGAPAKGEGTGGDVGAPAFAVGTTSLEVNRESRRLKIDLSTKKKSFSPGEEVEVDLAVRDRSGKAARADVAFYAVDEGVLMLTGYKTPDPIPTFTAPRPLAVAGLETREELAKVRRFGRGPGEDKGDEGGGGGLSARQDFRSTAVFVPSIVTDEGGRAKAKFKLPDSLTTYRLMAVASSGDDRFGFAEQQITTSRPLMARPALPRFFRAGDKTEAGVVLSTKGLAAGTFEVSIDTTLVKVEGETTKTVSVPAGGSVEARFVLATPAPGKAKIAFHARGLGQKDDVVVEREIMVPLVPEAVALYGETTQSVAERLGDLGSARPDTGGLDVRLASTALVGLDSGVEALLNYPYGCTEQLTSRTIPLVALVDLAHDYGIVLPHEPGKKADEALRKILENQRNDGGFGYWSDSGTSDPWLSAYALFGLGIAKDRGRFVPKDALDRGVRYLRAELAKKSPSAVQLSVNTFVLDVLTVLGSPDPGYMARAFEQRKSLPVFSRALLAHAMAKTQPKEAAELLVDLESHLRATPTGATVVENLGSEYAPLLDSEARTTAMVLRALVAVSPQHAMAARIAKGLLSKRERGAWRSTQENAWALLALDEYRKAQEATPPSFDVGVFVGENQVLDASFEGRSVKTKSASFAMPKLFESGAAGQNLAFQVRGSGKLFYEARLRYARKEMPHEGLDRGFFVRKLVRSLRPEALADAMRVLPSTSATRANGGDLVLVDLLVVTPDPREHVVIDDPLPAGLEAVQAKLATTAHDLAVTEPGADGDGADEERSDEDEVANGRGTAYAPYHREMRDDRVLTFVEHMPAGLFHYRYLARATSFGTFVVPPTRAECMYEPETFGRTAAGTFEVGAK